MAISSLRCDFGPALVKAHGAWIAVSSRAQRLGGVNFDDPNFLNSEYVPVKAYAQSKSANVLFAVELDRLGKAHGVRASAAHPSPVPTTNLGSSSLERVEPGISRSVTKDSMQVSCVLRISSIINAFRKLRLHHVGDEFKSSRQRRPGLVRAQ